MTNRAPTMAQIHLRPSPARPYCTSLAEQAHKEDA